MLKRIQSDNGVVFYASPLLMAMGIPHAFSTRLGGVSLPPFDSMNLGNPNGCAIQDDTAHIAENYHRLMDAIGCGHLPRHYLHQVHGDLVHVANRDDFPNSTKGDALVTETPGRVLSVRIADCCPILIAAPQRRGVAAVHAGWRGAVAGIIPLTIARLSALTGTASDQMTAAIGPCIGFDAFEVGPEVLAEFDRVFGPRSPVRRHPNGKGHANLPEAVRLQLLNAGLDPERIDATDRCTFRDKDEFYSHRRENGVTGRMAALIGI
jgi:YfiH family protein